MSNSTDAIRVEMGAYWIQYQPRGEGEVDISWYDPLRRQPWCYRMILSEVLDNEGIPSLAEIFGILKRCAEACHPGPGVVPALRDIEEAVCRVSVAAHTVYNRGEQVCQDQGLALALGILLGTFEKQEAGDDDADGNRKSMADSC